MCHTNQTLLTSDLRIVHATFSLTLAFFGACGNALSISVICSAQLYRTAPTMMLILDLSVANLMSTVLVLPIIAASSFHEKWIFGHSICKVFGYLMYVGITTECLILMQITILQYLVIVHRVSNNAIFNHNRHLHLFLLLGLPWLIVMAIYLIPLTETWDQFAYDPRRGYCTLVNLQDGTGFHATVAISLTAIMTIVMFYCYPLIFYVQFKSRRKTLTSVQEAATKFKGRSRNVQILKMIIAIICNYGLTYFPYLLISALDPCVEKISLAAYTVVIYITWSHTATNPIIYALMNSKINAQWRELCSCFRKKPEEMVTPTEPGGIKERSIDIRSVDETQG